MKSKLIAVRIVVCFVLMLTSAAQLHAGKLLTMDTEAAGEYYEADRSALDNQLNSEEELINDALSDSGTYYNRPQLVKLLADTRKIVLTFDDGPHPRTTPKVLEILRQRNIKAIFFVLGLQAAKYPALVKQIHDEGHLIGNHSYSHKNLAQLSEEGLRGELNRTSRLIESITGSKPAYLRPPYG
ncbi:MAG: chitin deacetylase, partial [uncultured bacterium]